MAVSTATTMSAGQKVQVRLPYVGTLPATVEQSSAETVLVTLAVPDPRVQRLNGSEVAVESTTSRGIQRFSGRLNVRSGELLEIVLMGDAERIQRREWARVGAAVPVRITPVEDKSIPGGETTSLNVSGGGVLIRDIWRLPLGLDVRVELVIDPALPPIRALARVVRDGGPDQKGLRFEDIAPPEAERLMRYVRERERHELRISRGR
jgi:c-di-GMP-binding flagellar brake protein YcgR